MTPSVKSVREYLREFVILALTIAVITLFKLYYSLNDYIIHNLTENSMKMEMVIEKNTQAIELLKR